MNIEKFCQKYNLGNVKEISKLTGGLMHQMFKVTTDNKTYAIKVLNKEVMSRSEAYNNFIISESISNLAKQKGLPVSNALNIENNYLTKYKDNYYMVFDFIKGNTLKENEINTNHCKIIGKLLTEIHSLDYKNLGINPTIIIKKNSYNWEKYINNNNLEKMSYKEILLKNYKKYNTILTTTIEKYNEINNIFSICHRDMDPKNIIWNNDNPIIIDWESASLSNPYIELLEDALSWSGFLSDNFQEEKFKAVFLEYSKTKDIKEIDWNTVICANLTSRFDWLKYNIERSLGIITNNKEEILLAEKEVTKTIDEINRYINLKDKMNDIIKKLINENKKIK